jgi:hypothetical protein
MIHLSFNDFAAPMEDSGRLDGPLTGGRINAWTDRFLDLNRSD